MAFVYIQCIPGTPVVEVDPLPLNVSINEEANFSCVVLNAHVVIWTKNGSDFDKVKNFTPTDSPPEKIDNSSALRYNISFIVSQSLLAQFDNSDIRCVGVADEPHHEFTESSGAKLMVQGLL